MSKSHFTNNLQLIKKHRKKLCGFRGEETVGHILMKLIEDVGPKSCLFYCLNTLHLSILLRTNVFMIITLVCQEMLTLQKTRLLCIFVLLLLLKFAHTNKSKKNGVFLHMVGFK